MNPQPGSFAKRSGWKGGQRGPRRSTGDRPFSLSPQAEEAWRGFFDRCIEAAKVAGEDPTGLRAAFGVPGTGARAMARPGDRQADLAVRAALLLAELFLAAPTPGVRASYAEALDASARLAWRLTCGGPAEEQRHASLGKDR